MKFRSPILARLPPFRYTPFLRLAFSGLVCVGLSGIAIAQPINFGRDVLPILSDRCFQCHGPDEGNRESDLRLDLRESAMADLGGYAAVVPGDSDASELLARISETDDDLVMPPPSNQRKGISEREVRILRAWIDEGAQWGRHWAFEKPVRTQPAEKQSTDMTVHPVDTFVDKRLEEAGLQRSPQASKHTLIRRLSFDLVGLPPTAKQVQEFADDKSPDAYEKLVERLLNSTHYGERMAMWWLDSARYADTDGFQDDATRASWLWRDWVVHTFNDNMPFDQFTVEQFAGDLLPDATATQKLATCFHRNHMTNGEGGRDPEESRIDYVIDRVNTTGTVWLGLTLGCAQCHSHKFDPISQRDYYSLSAFFNSIDEDGKAGDKAKPFMKYRSPDADTCIDQAQALVSLRAPVFAAATEQAKLDFEPWLAQQLIQTAAGFTPWKVIQANKLSTAEGTTLKQDPDGTIQASGSNPVQDDYRLVASLGPRRITGVRLEVFPHSSHTDGKFSHGASGEFILTDVKLQVQRKGDSQIHDVDMNGAVADVENADAKFRNYGKIIDTLDDDPRNGWTTRSTDIIEPHVAVFALAEPLELAADQELIFVMLQRSTDSDCNIGRFRVSVSDQLGPAVRSLKPMPLEKLAGANLTDTTDVAGPLREVLFEQFASNHPGYQESKRELDRATQQLDDFKAAADELKVMILKERKEPRTTHILERGVWDNKGEPVNCATPRAILDWPAGKTKSRLDLARWIVSPDNPLTARVIANQMWQLCFGAGLVRTPDDFGLQGQFPTHPDLLDWLAVELVDSGWDLKHLLKVIVTSGTYRQTSSTTSDATERDPENRLLARGARFRLPSWMIRDAALRASGLMNPTLGGPPVMPYQPQGVWAEMFMGRFQYAPSQGPAQFRRTVYAFWRRSSSPAFLFDAAQRRTCEVSPRRTNTPLHALLLLNNRTTLEAARELARQVLSECEQTTDDRIAYLYRAVLSRDPTDQETTITMRELTRAQQHYSNHPQDAFQLLNFGQPENKVHQQMSDVAPYMLVATLLLNLDEAVTHE